MTATATTTATAAPLSTPSAPLKIPTPEFTPIKTDLAPQRSFLRELCTKVANHWTSTFHSSGHLDNLMNVAKFSPKLNEPIEAWNKLQESTDNSTQVQVTVVGGAVGAIIKKGAEGALATIDKFNSGLKEITGCNLSTLTPEKRRELSTEQRAKVSALYTSLKGAFTDGEQQFNKIGTALNEVSTAISALLEKNAAINADLPQVDEKNSYRDTDLSSPEIGALAPNLSAQMLRFYNVTQTKIFNRLAESAKNAPDATKITAAATTATTELEKTQEAMNSFVNSVNEAVETSKQNKEILARLTNSSVPKDDEIVVTVAQKTLDAVKNWFTTKAGAAEVEIRTALKNVDLEKPEIFAEATNTFANNSKEYRATVQAIGKAILPFDILAKAGRATELFTETVGELKTLVENATVAILEKSDSHEVTMGKLQKLQELSAKIAENAQKELASSNGLTADEAAIIIKDMQSKVYAITDPSKWS